MKNTELTKIRENKNLSKSEFAKLLGVTAMLVGKYEKGTCKIPDHIAEKALALGAVKAVKGVKKTAATKKDGDKKAAPKEKKTRKASGAGRKKEPVLIIESLMGGTITAEEILSRIPSGVDEIYIKPEENKAYWVKGKKTGDVELW